MKIQHIPSTDECTRIDKTQRGRVVFLHLLYLRGIFALLSIRIGFSLVVFLAELATYKCNLHIVVAMKTRLSISLPFVSFILKCVM